MDTVSNVFLPLSLQIHTEAVQFSSNLCLCSCFMAVFFFVYFFDTGQTNSLFVFFPFVCVVD